tara:strand:+ start:1137 stop:2270 length:1134 start_codon:yes stop_codon:yes gene_type:complete
MDDAEIVYDEFLYPENDKRLLKFKSLSKEEQLNSIYLGSHLLEIAQDKFIKLKKGENKIEKEKLKSFYEEELREKEELVSELENKLNETDVRHSNDKRKLRENIFNDVKHQYETRYVDLIESLENELRVAKNNLNNLTTSRMEKQSEQYEEKLTREKEYQRKTENMRKDYELKLDEYRKKVEIVTEFNENSAKKGQEGENWIYNELIRQFPKATIIDCHKTPQRGDFTVEDDIKGMVESKNYKKNVPRKEIVKFKKDVETNDDFKYGILLSLKSGVTNRDDFCLEFCSGKPIMFCHFIKDNPSKIKLAHKICKLILKNMECFDTQNEEIKTLIKEKTKTMTARHNKMLSSIKNFTNDMDNQLTEQWSDFQEFLKHLN